MISPSIISTIFQFAGSLALLLFAMNMLSSGIQKGASEKLQPFFKIISGNRFTAVLTGLFVTAVIQSSGATTVMTISFVNAGVLSLTQAIGIIFGANIGTTSTAWIVSLLGFSFSITSVAIPIFGIGFYMYSLKKWKYHDAGEILMGFGLLFEGLGLLSDVLNLSPESVTFLAKFTNLGIAGMLLAVVIGAVMTALIHSSSAFTAIVLTLGYNKILPWEFSAALVLGSNIGSTIDALLASIGSTANAKRTALVHILFNVAGTLIALMFFRPLLSIVDFIVPGTPEQNITNHIAMLHTVFNVFATIIFLPFVNQIAQLVTNIIKDDKTPSKNVIRKYEPVLSSSPSASIRIIQINSEIQAMAGHCSTLVSNCIESLQKNNAKFSAEKFADSIRIEEYIDEMNETLTSHLVKTSHLDSAGHNERHKIDSLIQTVNYLELFSDECTAIMGTIKKASSKGYEFKPKSAERLYDYALSVQAFMTLIALNFNEGFSEEVRILADEMEDGIDKTRTKLNKMVTHRIEEGANVNSELSYLDLVRRFEKAADCLYSIVRV